MKKILSLLIAIVMVLGMIPVGALAAPTQGEDDVYQIGTAEDLLWFAQEVNGGNTTLSAVLTEDIDLSAVADWPGIGSSDYRFAGSFDGQNHTVIFKEAAVGLFGYIQGSSGARATVKNVRTKGSINDSGIAHEANYANIENCINGATITAGYQARVGGIVGSSPGVYQGNGTYKNYLTITKCGNEASVTAGNSVGGIIGWSKVNSRLDNCYNMGNINGTGDVGGLAGYLQSSFDGYCEIKNSYNTGTITSTSDVAGIIGCQMNGVKIQSCFNAGKATYAIAGYIYNNTATNVNCYYLGTASAKPTPDFTGYTEEGLATWARAVSAQYMSSDDFVKDLGDAFQQSCPFPVFTWQTPSEHTGSPCEKCHLGSDAKEIYNVSFQQHDGFTIGGANTVTQGEAYSFTVTINEGYKADAAFAVKVNCEEVQKASDGTYTVLNVSGPLSITVLDVVVIPGSYAISLPGTGNGYVAEGPKTAAVGGEYSFTITYKDGFKAGTNLEVIAQQVLTQAQINKGIKPQEQELFEKDGKYTIAKVDYNTRILVSGVEAVSKIDPVTINFRVTEGYTQFHEAQEDTMMNQTLTVPYFDLSLYGLEKYYYNPYCYKDENGNIRNVQKKGNPESAYDNITAMHAFVVATELYVLGYSQDDVGKGINPATVRENISWSQDAGSSFMDLWEHGTNLNYYLNYEYPLAYAGWGSTSDQILIQNGDTLTVHLITGQGSGASFGFFAVNDENGKYNKGKDVIDTFTVDQGEKLKLTLYWTSTTGNYVTKYTAQANKQLYWVRAGYEDADMTLWNTGSFGKTESLVTDDNGTVTINTSGLEPGTYYISSEGGFTAGGEKDNAGFVSAGAEAGPSLFTLVVKEYNGKTGDLDRDTQITAKDATYILRYVAQDIKEINEGIADVDDDGSITAKDATMILRYVAQDITSFPVDEETQ